MCRYTPDLKILVASQRGGKKGGLYRHLIYVSVLSILLEVVQNSLNQNNQVNQVKGNQSITFFVFLILVTK